MPTISATLRSKNGHDSHAGSSHAAAKPVHTVSGPVPVGNGSVTLEIDAPRSKGTSVLAGASATFKFRATGLRADDATLSASSVVKPGSRPRIVDIERSSTLALDTVAGQLFQLTDTDGHDHNGGQGSGLGLSTVAGSSAEWATGFSPGGSPIVSPDGRWVVVPHEEHPLVDVIDVLVHTVRAVTVGQASTAVAFHPGAPDEVWVADARGSVTVIDLAGAKVRTTFEIPFAVGEIAFADDGNHALVSGTPGGDSAVVDRAGLTSHRHAGAALHDMAWSPALTAFVGLDASGAVRSIGLDGSMTTIHSPASPLPAAELAIHPDGERAVYVDPTHKQARIIDLRRRAVLGSGDTGPKPSGVVVLDHFGIIRDAQQPILTWIDIANPDRSADLQLGVSEVPASVSVQPGSDEVLAPIPGQKKILRTHVMMGRPMVMASDNAGLSATTAAVSTAKLVRISDTVWQITTMIPEDGQYDLRFKTAAGTATFRVPVAGNSADATIVNPVVDVSTRVGKRVRVTVALRGASPDVVRLVAYDSDTFAQLRIDATRSGKSGSTVYYTATFTPTSAGEHQIFATATPDALIRQTLVARIHVDR